MTNLIEELKRLMEAEEKARDEYNDYTEKYEQPDYSYMVEGKLSDKKDDATEATKSFLYNYADEIIKLMEDGLRAKEYFGEHDPFWKGDDNE